MNYDKVRKCRDLVLVIIGVALLSYVVFKYLLIYLLPFLIGWFLAFAMRRPALFIARKIKVNHRIIRLILTLVLYFLIFGIASLAIWLLSREVWGLFRGADHSESSIYGRISELISADGLIGKIFGDFGKYVSDALYGLLTSMLTSVASGLSTLASAVPKAFLFLLVSVIASAYFAFGLEEVNSFVKRTLPERVSLILVKMKDDFLDTLIKYVRSYALLLGITFFEMAVALFILKAPYPLVVATVISLLDLLPVVGVGFVLIPWGVWSFAVGKTPFGIGLIVLFVFHTVLRETIEPKILGKNLGMHPLLTLLFIYVGYSLFGIMGLVLVPILTVLVNVVFGKKDSTEVA